MPYLFALITAIIVRLLVPSGYISSLGDWFNSMWNKDITFRAITDHILFIGNYDYTTFNSVIWSLIEEMRISIIFPLIMILVLRFSAKTNVFFALISSLGSYGVLYVKFHFPPLASIASFGSTLEWIPMFVVGALLAKNLDYLIKLFQKMSSMIRFASLLSGLMLYTFAHWGNFGGKFLHLNIIEDWFILCGVCIFIIVALSSKFTSKFLLLKPIQYVGKISYSIYLYHMIVLLALSHLLINVLPLWSIWLLTLISTFVIASLSYFLIELNCINIGRRLSSQGVNKRKQQIHAA